MDAIHCYSAYRRELRPRDDAIETKEEEKELEDMYLMMEMLW